MPVNAIKKIIKITLLSVSVLTVLHAGEMDEAHNPAVLTTVTTKKFVFNLQAPEFIPSETTSQEYKNSDSLQDHQEQCEYIDLEWIYANWSYPSSSYPDDLKATKGIKKRLTALLSILAQGVPSSIAQAYLDLGDAHVNHMCSRQHYYYNLAWNIGHYINDVGIIEKSYIALGNMIVGEQGCIESIAWYYEAFKLGNEARIKKLVQKKIKHVRTTLKNETARQSLTPDQITVVKIFFPQLAARYLN